MGSRALALTAAALAVLAVLVSDASATGSQRPPAGVPDPRLMVLTASDLGRAHVTSERYYRDSDFPSVISYAREFEPARVGSADLAYLDSEAEIGTSAGSTSRFLRSIKRVFGSKQGRKLIVDSIAAELPDAGALSSVEVARPRALGVGADSFDLPITVRALGLRVDAHIAAFRVDHVLGALVAVGELGERVTRSHLVRLARIMARRMGAQLAPRSTAPPVVSGLAAVGQTLTSTQGSWTGGPARFAYQWQRCDAAGASCASIVGATGASYVVAETDVGSTIRATVSARNAHGSATAVSAPTSVVPPSGPPVSAAPPTISGVAQVGQTLTAGTGTWTGAPTSFAYRWQRCDAAGAACVDISGATAVTYVLTSGDAGSTIRVAVTARSSGGEATAVSAPTAVVT